MLLLLEIEFDIKILVHLDLFVKWDLVDRENKTKQSVKRQSHHKENNEIKKQFKRQRIQQKKSVDMKGYDLCDELSRT